MTRKDFRFHIQKRALQGYYYHPEKIRAAVVLVHGMGEYARRYERTVVPALLKQSIAVLSFDQFGHGYSSGKKGHHPGYTYLLDAVGEMVRKAQGLFPGKPIYLYGHSMGGNVVINFSLQRKHALAGVVVTSPFLRLAFEPPSWKIRLGKLIGLVYPSLTMNNELDLNALSKDEQEIEAYKMDPLIHNRVSTRYSLEFMKSGEWAIKNAGLLKTPMLLLHGSEDRITSADATKEFAEKSAYAEYVKVKNGFHELHHDTEKQEVLDKIYQWIKEQITKS